MFVDVETGTVVNGPIYWLEDTELELSDSEISQLALDSGKFVARDTYADCSDECADHQLDCDGYCDHSEFHLNMCNVLA